MEKNEIFRKVGRIIAELNEQYQYLSEKPENLNDLELELFLANSNFLTDHIEILRKLNGFARQSPEVKGSLPAENSLPVTDAGPGHIFSGTEDTVSAKQPESSAAVPVPAQTDKYTHTPPEPAVETKPEEVKNAEDIHPQKNQLQEDNPGQVSENKMDEEVVKEIVIPEKTVDVEAAVPPDKPVSVPTINDLISARLNPSAMGKQFTQQPVTDLKSIINLNDKLLFIKELFNGYSLAYSEAIELLNRFDRLESADNFLKVNYASKNNWKEKQSAVDKFYEILNRRFAK